MPNRAGEPVSVSMPVDMPGLFRTLSHALTAQARVDGHPRVTVRALQERAVSEFLSSYPRGKAPDPVFIATPTNRQSSPSKQVVARRTVWLKKATLTAVKALAARHNVTATSVVLTAFHAFLDTHAAGMRPVHNSKDRRNDQAES